MRRIATTLKAGTLAVAVAVGGLVPATAHAGDRDTVRIIGGLVALGLIAKALDDNDRPQANRQFHATQPTYEPYGGYQAQQRQLAAERAFQRQQQADRAYRRQLEADRRAEHAYRQRLAQQRQAERAHQHQLAQQRQAERAYRRQLEQDRLARQERRFERRDDRFPRSHYAQPHRNDPGRTAQRRGLYLNEVVSPNH